MIPTAIRPGRTGSRSSGSENSGLLQAFAKQTECGNDEKKLADQQARHISGQSEAWHGKEHEEQPEQKAGCALDRQCSCLPKPMQDAGQCGGGIEQRAEQRKASDAAAGFLAVKEQLANDISGEKKEGEKNRPSSRLPKNEILETETMRDSCRSVWASEMSGRRSMPNEPVTARWKQKQRQYHSA